MGQTTRNLKIMTGVVAGFLLLTLAGTFYYWDRSRDIAREKVRVEQQANALLLGQSRDIDNLNKKISAAGKEKTSLTTEVDQLNESLDERNSRLAALNANYRSAASALTRYKDSMQLEHSAWEDQTKKWTEENLSFVNRNTALDNELTLLRDQIQKMVPASVLTVDGFRVKAVKHNNKETAKAKKVHTLMISFQVPAYFTLSGSQEVYLSLTDLGGNSLLTPLRTVTVVTPDGEKLIPVHAVKTVDFNQKPQQTGFNLETEDEIKPGLYRASVYTQEGYLGAVEFGFRDSFWFF